ncbi:MAG: flagellar basal-body MS-ring/collar protein FliF [Gemmatimonadaceae bacterium]
MADGIDGLIERIGGWRRLATIGVGIGAVALIIGVSRWAGAPTWVPVVSDAPLDQVSAVSDRLTQAGIPNRLDRGGADVTVAVTDLPRARVALAKEGLPTSGRPGWDLFDKPAYAMTNFTEKVNYRRALEGELERTIGKMRGIQSAQVHLALHETSSFRAANTPSEASVVLSLRNGEEPAPAVVQGITHLVASSVDGLVSDQVTVVDDAGRLLSIPNEEGSLLGLTSRQLANQREVEQDLRDKAEMLLSQMVGQGNARVQVSAALNFDRLERTTQTLDPDKQVAASEQKAEITPGAQGGAASSNQATTYENSKSTEVFANALGTVRRLTIAVLVNDKMTGAGDSAKFSPRTAQELTRIETLVKSAVGYDSTRGDFMSVVSVPFSLPSAPVAAAETPPTLVQKVQQNQSLVMNAVALVFAFVIGFMALKSVRGPKQLPRPAAATAQFAPPTSAPALPAPIAHHHPIEDAPLAPKMVPELAAMQANAETRNRVTATVDQQPEVAAKLVRAWMKEA